MSIQTNELQQLQSILGTDSLLADTAAAGTGRLSLARAAEFFGAELIKPGNPVGAALSNKAALSAQQIVEATSVPSRTVEVAAADLPAYIACLPRLLAENLTVTVLGGSCGPNGLYIHNFYGPGRLTVQAAEGAEVLCPLILEIFRCAVPVAMAGFRIEGPSGAGSYVQVGGCRAYLSGFTVDGASKNHNGGAFAAISGGMIYLHSSEIKNIFYALVANTGGTIIADSVTASGNTTGAASSAGGIITLAGTTPELVGGTVNSHWGGLIINKNGELI